MKNSDWTKQKPTEPGAYYVRGWAFCDPHKVALVEVRCGNTARHLFGNLHAKNSDDFETKSFPIRKYSNRLEWLCPLLTPL
jgi:hypothetical protein